MGVCILGMGDCGNKSSSSFTTNVSLINQSLTNMVNSTSNSTIVKNFNSQNMEVNVGGKSIGCTYSNNQNINASQKVSVSLDVSNTKNLQAQITNSLKASNDQAVKQQTGVLQTASSSTSTATTVNQAISNLVSTNITDSVLNQLSVILNNAQKNKVNIKGDAICTKENPTLSSNVQNILSSQIVDTITKALTGTTLSTLTKNESDIKNRGSVDQKGGGLDTLISSFFSGLSSLFTGPIMIIGLIVIVLAVLAFVFKGTISKIAESKAGVSSSPAAIAQFGRRLAKMTRFGARRLRR